MTLPTSGAIGLFDIRTELGIANTQQIGLTDSNVRTLAGRPSGSVDMPNDFYGKSNYPPYGTYLTQYCSGYNLYYRYANGTGGYYDTLQQSNSPTCGWPPPATYQLTTTVTSVDEGYGVTVNITTTYFNNGTGNGDLYWRIIHNTTSSADFSGGLDSGVSAISNNSGSFAFYTTADQLTEGTENFYAVVSLTPGGAAVASTSTLDINDTSTTPQATFTLTPQVNPIIEGETLILDITAQNFGSGTLYWKIPQFFGDITSADLNGVSLDTFYAVSVTNNVGTIYIPTVLDTVPEYNPNAAINTQGSNFSVFLYNSSYSVVANRTGLFINERTEVISGPNYGSPNVAYNVTISNGVPNTSFSWTRSWITNDAPQTATLDGNGSYTFTGIIYPASPLPFTYSYPFTFSATGRTGTYSIYIS